MAIHGHSSPLFWVFLFIWNYFYLKLFCFWLDLGNYYSCDVKWIYYWKYYKCPWNGHHLWKGWQNNNERVLCFKNIVQDCEGCCEIIIEQAEVVWIMNKIMNNVVINRRCCNCEKKCKCWNKCCYNCEKSCKCWINGGMIKEWMMNGMILFRGQHNN